MRWEVGAAVRNGAIRRVVAAYAVFVVVEYAVWVAMLVYAYDRGGATEAGLIAVVQLIPAGVVAPLAAVFADRSSPLSLFVTGCALQAVGMSLAALVILAHGPALLAVAGAVVASTFVSAIRPAQAVLLPGLARTADELTAANVIAANVEAVAITVAGLLSGLLLHRGAGAVFAAGTVLIAISAAIVAPIPTVEPEGGAQAESAWVEVVDGARAMRDTPGAGTLVGLLAIQDVVLGALDVLFVVVAISVLHHGRPWAGYLNTAYGVGGIAIGAFTMLLIGRRLPAPILVTSGLVGLCLALTGCTTNTSLVVAMLIAVGASRSVLELATRTLLQRSVPSNVVGRIFGLLEGASMIGVAAGSLLVSALVAVVGARGALIGVGALLPAYALATTPGLLELDRENRVPIVEINLLRSIPMFAQLPAPALEAAARSLRMRRLQPGERLITEGEIGEDYFAIADGHLEVRRNGRVVRHVGRGAGVGEIALMRTVARTASVVSVGESLVYALDRISFLAAVTGHAPTSRVTAQHVASLLSQDAAAGSSPAR